MRLKSLLQATDRHNGIIYIELCDRTISSVGFISDMLRTNEDRSNWSYNYCVRVDDNYQKHFWYDDAIEKELIEEWMLELEVQTWAIMKRDKEIKLFVYVLNTNESKKQYYRKNSEVWNENN